MKPAAQRLKRYRAWMQKRGVDLVLITHLPNIRYLANFSGSAGYLIVRNRRVYFVSDFRYRDQAHQEVFPWIRVRIPREVLREVLHLLRPGRRIGLEAEHTTLGFYRFLEGALTRRTSRELVPLPDQVLRLRAIKDGEEIARIRKAQEITDRIFEDVLNLVEPERMTELDLAAEIEYRMKKYGASGPSFPTIVASGTHTALPHAQPRPVKIAHNAPLLLDFGCVYEGYASDMTRTVWIGSQVDPEFEKIYHIVNDARARAIEAARPGMSTADLDEVARAYIRNAGYGEAFGHSLGHGVGLEIHEAPWLAPRRGKRPEQFISRLRVGHVVTIEPGIYLPHLGGVRIEDLVVIRPNGAKVLTQSPRELIRL